MKSSAPVAILTLFLAVSLAGCNSTASPPSAGDGTNHAPLDSQTSKMVEKQVEQYRNGVLALFPDADLPNVDPIRLVTTEEWPKVVAQCVTEAGFPAKITADGGVDIDVGNPAQEEAMWIADFVCKSQYPIDPRYQQPLDESQQKRLYRYYVTKLMPCVESFGIPVDDPPTETVFLQDINTDHGWHPYDHVDGIARDQLESLLTNCPQQPPDSFR